MVVDQKIVSNLHTHSESHNFEFVENYAKLNKWLWNSRSVIVEELDNKPL